MHLSYDRGINYVKKDKTSHKIIWYIEAVVRSLDNLGNKRLSGI